MTPNDKTLFKNMSSTTKHVIRNAVSMEILRKKDDLANVIMHHGPNTAVVDNINIEIKSMELFLQGLYGVV